MIVLTRLNGQQFVLNADLIRTIEQTPDTTISLTTGERLVVLEPLPQVVDLAIEYARVIRQPVFASN